MRQLLGARTRYLLLAVGAAVIAGVFARVYLANLDRRVPVVVAARDLPAFTVLEPGMLKTHLFPPEAVHPAALAKAESAVGLVTLVPRASGEVILSSTLADGENPGEYRASLDAGERALYLPSDAVLGEWRGVEAGDYVDLTVVLDDVSRCAGQGLEVLLVVRQVQASGPLSAGRDDPPLGAFLRVTPVQAEVIALAVERGTVFVSVLGYSGLPVATSGLRLEELRVLAPLPAMPDQTGGVDDGGIWP